MKKVFISLIQCNYLKDDGTYLLDEHVEYCDDFENGFAVVKYNNLEFNLINEEGKRLLKTNVMFCFNFDDCFSSNKYFSHICINKNSYSSCFYYIDKECNFYNLKEISFKELYKQYPNKRQELIDIIDKYTYHDTNEYFK